jgi:hypothetical protein
LVSETPVSGLEKSYFTRRAKHLGAMEPNLKLAIDEQSKLLREISERLAAQDARWRSLDASVTRNTSSIQQLETTVSNSVAATLRSEIDSHVATTVERLDAVEAAAAFRVGALESATAAFDSWRPYMEASVDDLKYTMNLVRQDLAKQRAPPPPSPTPSFLHATGVLGSYQSPGARPPPTSGKADGPVGHRVEHQRRESGFGRVYAQTHLPHNGTPEFLFHPPFQHIDPNSVSSGQRSHGFHPSSELGQLPRVSFPPFDGDNPRLWQTHCENYFAMYEVHPRVWIKVATMHFSGAASRWLQSVEHKLPHISWSEFGFLLRERFGKDQHAILIRQLFHIKQLGSVAEYIDQFAQLVDQLNSYQPMSDPLYYTMRFLDGLRHDIKSIVMIQRPKDLDTAYVLAQLQDEIGATHKPREFNKFDPRAYSKSSQRVPMPLPPPPTGGPTTRPEVKTPATAQPDRLSSVYAYRKAKGLCYKCGLAYSRGHTCPDTVQLHMVEELWQQFQLPQEDNVSEAGQSETLNCLHLCQSLSRDDRQSKSMRFVGEIRGLSVLILLDSGSSISFISSSIVPHVPMLPVSCPLLLVQVANDSKLSCCAELTNAEWSIQGHRFTSTLKILDLQPFDMIIGMDWLSEHSPMWVHWADKWLSLTVGSSLAKLYGVQASDGQSALVQLCSLSHLPDTDQHIIQSLPPELQSLLDRYSSVFAVPQGLPPVRDCDHRIPLIPGARPVQMRPYRYAPALKTEIEKQIDDMLGSGLIQHSKSPFSFSVILVKKKDNSYRFCVDYRHLNALTAKA